MIKDHQSNLVLATLEEALRLEEEIKEQTDANRKVLQQKEYAKILSRINEIKNPNVLMLLRYE